MSRFVALRRVSLGVPLLLCLVIAVYGMIRLASWSRTRSPAGSGASDERLIARARKLLEAGRPREALLAISGVRIQGRRAADLLLVEGLARAAIGDSEPARQALLRSTAIHFEQPMAFKVLAAIAFSRGEEQRGLEYLAQAATLDPGDFRPLYAIGEVHLRNGPDGRRHRGLRSRVITQGRS